MWEWFKRTVESPDGLRSSIVMVVVAIFLTLYEFSLFYKVVVPTVKDQIDKGITKLTNDFIFSNSIFFKDVLQGVGSLLDVFDERERILTDRLNDYTKYTSILIILVLMILLVFLTWFLNSKGNVIGMSSYVNIVVTLVLTGVFQYYFYVYGNSFNYMRDEELNVYLLNGLDLE